MIHDVVAVLLGLITGGTMAVAVSGVWIVLHLPARLQDRFQAASPRLMTWAMFLGLTLSAMQNGVDFSFRLPEWAGAAALLGGGMFVGMVASALGEILEVVPVLMRRFRLGDVSNGFRWVMMVGKGLGAVLGCLVFTL